jgi:hypothetical protein
VGKIGRADLSVGVGLEPLDVGAEAGDIHPSQVAQGRRWGNATVPAGGRLCRGCLRGGFGWSHGSFRSCMRQGEGGQSAPSPSMRPLKPVPDDAGCHTFHAS